MKPYYEHKGVTIYHGDCRELLPLLGHPDLIIADPPYGVREQTNRKTKGRSNACESVDFKPVFGDDQPFDPSPLLAMDCPLVLFGGNHFSNSLPPSPSWIVWDKKEGGTPDDNADCELAWSNLGGPVRMYSHLWRGMIKGSERGSRRVHPTQKPVALMAWIIHGHTKENQLIVDPYMGSGPVLLAAKNLSRRAIGIETEEEYCEAAAKRLSQEVFEF